MNAVLLVVLAGAAAWLCAGPPLGRRVTSSGQRGLTLPRQGRGARLLRGRVLRAEHRASVRELPHLVGLMVGPLRAGASPTEALTLAVAALPGPAGSRFLEPLAALAVGADPHQVWRMLSEDPAVGDLGHALARAGRSGASVVETVQQLADELLARAATEVEDRARTIGVRAAVPLGLCLLPAFLLLGVVPMVGGLFASVLA